MNEIKEIYNRIKNGGVAWLTESEINNLEEYVVDIGDDNFLNQYTCNNHTGEGVYKCHLQ